MNKAKVNSRKLMLQLVLTKIFVDVKKIIGKQDQMLTSLSEKSNKK